MQKFVYVCAIKYLNSQIEAERAEAERARAAGDERGVAVHEELAVLHENARIDVETAMKEETGETFYTAMCE